MALPPVVKEPEKVEPKAEEVIAQERAQLAADRARLEKEMTDRGAAQDQRMAQMEGYLAGHRQQPQAPVSAAQAQEELGLTQEQIAKDPEGALKQLEEHMRKKAVKEVRGELEQQYAPVIQGLAEQAFSSGFEALRSRKYFPELEGQINQYFASNPAERQIPGRLTEVYEALVGRNVEQLEKQAAERHEKEAVEKGTESYVSNSSAEPPIRATGFTSSSGSPEDKAEPELSEEEEYMRQKYNRLGANISKREWVEIAEGRAIPKSQAADWQKGWRTENRKVTRGE